MNRLVIKKAGNFLCLPTDSQLSASLSYFGLLCDRFFFFLLKTLFLSSKHTNEMMHHIAYFTTDYKIDTHIQRSKRLFLQLQVALRSVQINYRDIFYYSKLFINAFSLEINF